MPSYGSWESPSKMNNLEANAGRRNFGRGFSFGETEIYASSDKRVQG